MAIKYMVNPYFIMNGNRVEYNHRWYEANKERAAENRRRWRKENPVRYKELTAKHNRKWKMENPERRRELNAKWRRAHPEQSEEIIVKWRKANPDKVYEMKRRGVLKRRALKRGLPSEPYITSEIYSRDNGICGICRKSVRIDEFEIDHVIPISKGGPDTSANVQVAHSLCNKKKGGKV